mgnify:CR=1 FL=1
MIKMLILFQNCTRQEKKGMLHRKIKEGRKRKKKELSIRRVPSLNWNSCFFLYWRRKLYSVQKPRFFLCFHLCPLMIKGWSDQQIQRKIYFLSKKRKISLKKDMVGIDNCWYERKIKKKDTSQNTQNALSFLRESMNI